MTSDDQKPPDKGGGVGTIEDNSKDTNKSSEESTTGEKSLGSSAVAGEETISNEVSATGEKSLGSYASVAASATKDPWSSAESKFCKERNYEEILKESKDEAKNVLNVRIEKIRSQEWVPGLTQEDVEHILFNELKIDVDAVVEVDVTSRYNFKEIIFKKDHDIVKYQRPPFVKILPDGLRKCSNRLNFIRKLLLLSAVYKYLFLWSFLPFEFVLQLHFLSNLPLFNMFHGAY